MTDPDLRLDALDLLEPTDLTDEIERRADLPEPAPRPEPPRRRVAAGLLAAALFTAVAVFAWSALRTVEGSRPVGPTPEPAPSETDGAWRGVGERFSALPSPPAFRTGDVRVWTGRELIVWGGNERSGEPPHFADGWAFDPGTMAWRELPPAPLSPRSWAAGVWTGSEVVIWGGSDGRWPGERLLGDGAAYDPVEGRWRSLASSPLAPGTPAVSVWTGSEVVLWGSLDENASPSGAAYRPASDTWRMLAPAPDELTQSVVGAWTGEDVVILGGHGRRNEYEAVSLAYDPAADAWRTLGPPGLDDNLVRITPWRDTVVAVDTYKRVAVLDRATGTWEPLPRVPTRSCDGFLSIGAASDALVVGMCEQLVSWSPGSTRWHVPTEPPPIVDLFADAGEVVLATEYGEQRRTWRLAAFRPPVADPSLTLQDAHDLATAFAALRSHYPFGDGDVPPDVEAQMRTMLSPDGSAVWDRGRISALWAYYPGFEVRSVEGPIAGTSDVFRALIRLTGYDGLEADEEILMAPGADLDGTPQELVIVDARPAGGGDHPQPVELPDGTREVTLRSGEVAEFPAGVLTEGDAVLCGERRLQVPAPGNYVEDPPDEPGPDPDRGELRMTANLDGSVVASCGPTAEA